MENPEALVDMQRKVQMMMGRCLLNYQLIEGQLKHIIKISSIEIRRNKNGEYQTFHSDVKRKTLGLLFQKYFSDIALPTECTNSNESRDCNAESDKTFSVIQFRQIFDDPNIYTSIRDRTEILVKNRNSMVHHFRENYLLDSIESCEAGMNELEKHNVIILEQFNFFKQIISEIDNAYKQLHI